MIPTTPVPPDIYTRFMSDMFSDVDLFGVDVAGQAYFGNPMSDGRTFYSPDRVIADVDIVRGNDSPMSIFVTRGTESRTMKGGSKTLVGDNFTSLSMIYPLIKDTAGLSAHELLYRTAGEDPYTSMTKRERLRVQAKDKHDEVTKKIIRLFEYCCWQSLLTGLQPAIFGTTDSNFQYDMYRRSSHIFDAAALWTTAATDILADVDTACDLIRVDSALPCDMCVVGAGGLQGLFNNTQIDKFADNQKIKLVIAGGDGFALPAKFNRWVAAGFIPRAHLTTAKGNSVYVFAYLAQYTNPLTSAVAKFVPDGTALFSSSQARFDRFFGPHESMPMTAQKQAWYMDLFGFAPNLPAVTPTINPADIINPSMFHYDAYGNADDSGLTMRTQSAPIFVTRQTDALVTINALSS